MSQVKQNLYTYEDYRYKNKCWRRVTLPDGYLYSKGRYPTKLRERDLPEWYVYGRYYKRFGYLSAKGITDMLYIPSKYTNHFLKDDCLFISYGGKIEPNQEKSYYSIRSRTDDYTGWDECVWGNEILDILKAAEKYSGYNICLIADQIKQTICERNRANPENIPRYSFDFDDWLARPYEERNRSKRADYWENQEPGCW